MFDGGFWLDVEGPDKLLALPINIKVYAKIPGALSREFVGAALLPVFTALSRPLLLEVWTLLLPAGNPRVLEGAPKPGLCNEPRLRSWPISPFAFRFNGGNSSATLS